MSGWDAAAAGIDPGRVAELLVTPDGPGPGRRGSGYRVSASAVLTAAHVVLDAARVRVRFDADRAGEWLAEGTVAWLDPTIDVAVVSIAPRPQDDGHVAAVGFGRAAERDAVVGCSAMGFPRFKLRGDPTQPLDDGSPSQYRDSVHAVGTIAVLSNRREGTLEVSVAAPERDPDPARSPWEGMSGAAVWSAGRIIGLVAEHHRADGLGRLAATRVDRWYEHLTAEQLAKLQDMVSGLPAQANDLVDVVPPASGELLEAGYTAQVRDIAPEKLIGRDEELAELVRFCAGEERYQWWQAAPWAGKSALAAWFVLHAPAGVTVVSFFVTGRLAGQADSDAFTDAMVEQLAAVAGEPIAGTATPAGRDRERRRLLDVAAARVGKRGGQLLLLIDGLDEDEGAKPGGSKPSIASLLPKRPPRSVRVLVFSRPSPGVPGDVPVDHPLRHCAVSRLAPWSDAYDVRLRAKYELLQQLHGDQLQVDVIGSITAAGGGLTLTELAELTRRPKYLLDGKLGSTFGRSLKTRLHTDRSPDEDSERVYLFAHETLRIIAEEELAGDLEPYRERIDAWADDYRTRGWPADTPRYLFRPYGRLLATSGDLKRLIVLATDPARHDRMLAYTQGDAAALAEIATTQQLILSQPVPDLVAMASLAVYRDRLANRNLAIPIELPALWVKLGRSQRGEALARSTTDLAAQVSALMSVAKELAQVDRDRALSLAVEAEQTARSITNRGEQTRSLARVSKALADVDRDLAIGLATEVERASRVITDYSVEAEALTIVAKALAEAGQWHDAEQAARSITDPDAQAEALTMVAKALAEAGQWHDAEQAARSITHPYSWVEAFTVVARVLAKVDQDRAIRLANEAEQIARSLTNPSAQVEALTDVIKALAEVDQDRAIRLANEAEQIARSLTNPSARVEALITVANADQDRAIDMANEAERTARSITQPYAQAEALTVVTRTLAEVGQWDHAEQSARSIANPDAKAQALTTVAKAIARVDQHRAVSLTFEVQQATRRITNSTDQAEALTGVAKVLAEVGQLDRAENAVRNITDLAEQAKALTTVAKALVESDRDRARSLAAKAEQTARSITDPSAEAEALTVVAKALADAGQWDRAEQVARSITDPSAEAEALTVVARALADAGQWDRAEQVARSITHQADRTQALAAIARALADAGQWDRAEQTARSITHPPVQVGALLILANALTKIDRDRAVSLVKDVEHAARSITDPSARIGTLTTVARSLATVDRNRAFALVAEIEQTARSITDPDAQAEALKMVAKALADAGQWDRAEQVARSITRRADQARALLAVVKALADVGQWDRAEQAAHSSIMHPSAEAEALTVVAKALADAGHWDRADQVARSITDPSAEAEALTMVARALADAGQWDRAEQVARSITNPFAWVETLITVTRALAKVDRDRALSLAVAAEQTVHSITNPYQRTQGLVLVARALADAGQWDRAEQVARSITRPADQTQALTAIAKALADAGQWDRAQQVGRSIIDPDDRARGYLEIAASLTAAYQMDRTPMSELMTHARACQLLAPVLGGGLWLEAIRLLGKLDPLGMVTIHEALNAIDSRKGSRDASSRKETLGEQSGGGA